MNLRTRVTVVFATAAVAATAAFPALSGASPIDDKRRQAAELQRQIDANDNQIVTLSERLNGATYRRQQAEVAMAEAQRRTDAAIAQRKKIRDILGVRAAQIYKGAGSSTPLSQMDVSNVNDLAARSKYASAAADHDNVLIAKLQKAQEELDARKADLDRQRAAAKAEGDAAAAAKSRIESANQQKLALKNQVSGEIANLLAQEQQARAAAQQRVAAAGPPRTNTGSSGSRGAARSRRTSRTHPPRTVAPRPRSPSPRPRSARATGTPRRVPTRSTAPVSPPPPGSRAAWAWPTTRAPSTRRRSGSVPATCSPVTSSSTAPVAPSTSRSTSVAAWWSRPPTRRAA